jgi:hypothetical protein
MLACQYRKLVNLPTRLLAGSRRQQPQRVGPFHSSGGGQRFDGGLEALGTAGDEQSQCGVRGGRSVANLPGNRGQLLGQPGGCERSRGHPAQGPIVSRGAMDAIRSPRVPPTLPVAQALAPRLDSCQAAVDGNCSGHGCRAGARRFL